MIISFKFRDAELLFDDKRSKKLPSNLQRNARRKLLMLNAAHTLKDLETPPGNRLEALRGSRKGQYSIRINDKWRICFYFDNGHVSEVEITDYH